MTGTGKWRTALHRSRSAPMKRRPLAAVNVASSLMSAPAMKARAPEPRSTRQCSWGFCASSSSVWIRLWITGVPSTLSTPASVMVSTAVLGVG